MRIGRTLPPAAAPIGIRDLLSGIRGMLAGEQALDRFRLELQEHFGVKHCFLVSSGKAAFALILLALKQLSPDRDEVLIPAFTCYSVPSSIVRAGLRMRLCDLHPERLDFDFAQLSALLSAAPPPQTSASPAGGAEHPAEKALAVVPTHLFGFHAEVARLRPLVRRADVAIVEDAAQAMGETGEDGKIGTLGDAGFFSLGRGKAFSVVEGGVILTNRDDLAEVLNSLVSRLPRYGLLALLTLMFKAAALMVLMHPRFFWVPRSLPFLKLGETLYEPHFPLRKMSSFQAGLAKGWRATLERLRGARKANADRWVALLAAAGIHGPEFPKGPAPGLLRFPIRIGDSRKRESLLRESAASGLGIMPVYPTAIHAIPGLEGKTGGGTFPVAERCARELVTLPTHRYLTAADVSRLSKLISRALG